jgi:photosystem II stability/assembly factor-like uncharacterized protein
VGSKRQRQAVTKNVTKDAIRAQGVRQSSTNGLARPKRASIARQNAARSRWSIKSLAVVLLIGVVLVGIAAYSLFGDDEQPDNGSGVSAIASIKSPDVHSLLIDLTDPDHALFGSHAGIMETRDGGFTWEDGTLQGKDAMSMSRSAQDPTTIYVTGHDVVEVSRDGGASWQPLQHDLPGTDIHAFAQDPVNPQTLYAFVVGHGVFISQNGGEHWTALETQPPGETPYSLVSDGSQVYAVTNAGIVTSADQGASWSTLATQPGDTVLSLAIPANAPQVIYAGTQGGLVKSTDGGASWVSLGPDGAVVLALAVAPTDSNRVLLVSDQGKVYRSDDGGMSWVARR